jgi:DNA polymerase (family 10)
MLEFNGENKFKVNAYRNGALALKKLDAIEELIKNKTLGDIKGIGKGIQAFVYDYYENGFSKDYNNLKSKLPDGIMELFDIKGIGTKKIKQIYDELNISNLEQLENACNENKIAPLKGFGEKTQSKIIEEIKRLKSSKGLLRLNHAFVKADDIIEKLKKLNAVKEIEYTGELRRVREVISKIEIIILTNDFKDAVEEIGKQYSYDLIDNKNYKTLKIENDLAILIHITGEENFDEVLYLTTAEKSFKENMSFAASVNIIPEMMEEQYFDLNEKLKGNSDLAQQDFKGFFHFHTMHSDGMNSLDEMVAEGAAKGFEYFAVCDHSKSAFYANGLTEDRILQQREEINQFNESNNTKVYHGIESDILRDGSLDYDNDFMTNFQFVVIAVHSIFNIDENEMTKRVIKAIENPHSDVLAHPTGRLLLSRNPYKINITKVIDACVQNNVAIEINANPRRLDLDWRNIFYAREKGCKFAINPDAHSTKGISDIKYGIMIGRKGGLQKEEVINCYSEKEFLNYINRKVTRT